MPRRALRPSFVVTFALGAAALASGCGKDSGGGGISNPPGPSSDGGGDSSVGDGGCPAEVPLSGEPCDLPSSMMCNYQGGCGYLAQCNGVWSVIQEGCGMNPPPPPSEAGSCDMPLDAAFTCGSGDAAAIPPPGTSSAACNQCIESCCSMEWCACAADSSVNDAGQPDGCLGYFACVQTCHFPEDGGGGGTVTACATVCDSNYSNGPPQEGSALVSCILGSCAAQCGQ